MVFFMVMAITLRAREGHGISSTKENGKKEISMDRELTSTKEVPIIQVNGKRTEKKVSGQST